MLFRICLKAKIHDGMKQKKARFGNNHPGVNLTLIGGEVCNYLKRKKIEVKELFVLMNLTPFENLFIIIP